MLNKINALRNEIDTLKNNSIQLFDSAQEVISEYINSVLDSIPNTHNVYINRINFYTKYDNYENISFDLVVRKDDDRDWFGSDMYFEYSVNEGLKVNCGCVGLYGIENEGQVQRINVLYHFFKNNDSICEGLKQCMTNIKDYMETEREHIHKVNELSKLQKELDLLRKKDIEDKIVKGIKLRHSGKRGTLRNVFIGTYTTATVERVNSKTYTLRFGYGTEKVNKEFLIEDIFKGVVIIDV